MLQIVNSSGKQHAQLIGLFLFVLLNITAPIVSL